MAAIDIANTRVISNDPLLPSISVKGFQDKELDR